MITGFQAQMAVDDAGTGAASGGASTKFSGLTTFSLPDLETPKFDATELDQVVTGTTPDPYERELPTGTIKVGPTQAEIKYTKANFLRLQSLLKRAADGDTAYTFILTSPDDKTDVTAVKLLTTFDGWVSKVGGVKYEKGNPVSISFELTAKKAPTYS
jgi:hypothetical protein